MIQKFRSAAVFCSFVAFVNATPVSAQQSTDEQRSAIRSACRTDYEANCSSVPPGGMASLQCLQQNMSKLSGACQSAVSAIEPAAAPPKAEAAPVQSTPAPSAPAAPPATTTTAAPSAPKAAASAPAVKPTDAQSAAIRSACRADYQSNCASVPPGGTAALNCLEKNKSKLSANCQKAVAAVSGAGATTAPAAGTGSASSNSATATSPAATDTAPPPVIVLRPLRPREELFVLRSACGGDVRAICGAVPPGGGRIVQCLAANTPALSPACKQVLAQFAAQ